MGNWVGTALPATGVLVAVDSLPGSLEIEAVKLDQGGVGNSVTVQEGSGLSTADDTGTMAVLQWLLRSLGNVDAAGKLNVDIASTMTGGVLTTVSTVTTVTSASNLVAIAGVGIEQFKNPAITAYLAQINACYGYS